MQLIFYIILSFIAKKRNLFEHRYFFEFHPNFRKKCYKNHMNNLLRVKFNLLNL